MSRVEELEDEIKGLENRKIELLKELEVEKQKTVIDYPFEDKEEYFCLNINGEIIHNLWWGGPFDEGVYTQGHVFKNREEARKERDKRYLLMRFNQFRDKCNGNWHPNWNTSEEKKYFIELYPMKGLCSISEDVFRSSLPLFGHFKTVNDCKRAIELFGQEIKKLYGLEW